MHAVWMVRFPQIKSRIRYWLSALGYEFRDRSVTNRIFFLYFLAFWSGWTIAVLSLLAGGIATLLASAQIDDPSHTLVVAGTSLFFTWVLVNLFRVSRKSPFIFSEADVYLICQTPIDRRYIALVWILSEWFEDAIVFWIGGFILGFAFAELQIEASLEISELVLYLDYSFRAFIIILLIQFAYQALIWSFGTTRLRGEREVSWLFLIPSGLAMWLVISILLNLGRDNLQNILSHPLLLPIYFPFQSVFGHHEFVYGVVVSLSLAILSLGIFWMVTGKLNLGRAAAETYQQKSIQMAESYGNTWLAQEIQLRKRLGFGRKPNKLPDMNGIWSLLWKEILQTWRTLSLRDLTGWLSIFGFILGILLIPDWSLRALILIIWVTILGDRTVKHFRNDLSHWWLFRLLPFDASRIVITELMMPWTGYVITGWIALFICRRVIAPYTLLLASLLPFMVAGIILSATDDILHQSKASLLLVGEVPRQRALASFLGALLIAIPIGILWWLREFPYLGSILGFAILIGGDYLIWRDLTRVYRRIS